MKLQLKTKGHCVATDDQSFISSARKITVLLCHCFAAQSACIKRRRIQRRSNGEGTDQGIVLARWKTCVRVCVRERECKASLTSTLNGCSSPQTAHTIQSMKCKHNAPGQKLFRRLLVWNGNKNIVTRVHVFGLLFLY